MLRFENDSLAPRLLHSKVILPPTGRLLIQGAGRGVPIVPHLSQKWIPAWCSQQISSKEILFEELSSVQS